MTTPILIYSANLPPLSPLAVIELRSPNVKVVCKASLPAPCTLVLPSGVQVVGEPAALRFLSRLADQQPTDQRLYDMDHVNASIIDYFVDLAFFTLKDPSQLEQAATLVNSHLQMRTFIVGHSLSAADLAIWSVLSTQSQNVSAKFAQFPHLDRWFSHCQTLKPLLNVLSKAFPAKPEAPVKDKGGAMIILDESMMGRVVTRFPPEPSGYLHIGHAKAAMLNYDLTCRYKGRMIVRFDDTNPSKEKQEFVDAIMEDLVTLNVVHTPPITYSSDHFDWLIQQCSTMIESGKAYVDFTEKLQAREEREQCVDGQCRGHTIKENLHLWEEMQKGSPSGVRCVVRAKISMQHRNAAMRDPAMFRCNSTPHHRTGEKYKVYPTYDFTCPLIDSLEGVTHALRTIEYRDRNEQYSWFCQALNLREPVIIDFARMNLIHTVLSKRKLTRLVDSNVVTGWDDPRFPTVRGMVRRGLQIGALREFVLDQGATKSVALMEWDKIWNLNKKIVDPIAWRFTAVAEKNVVPFHLENCPIAPENLSVRLVPKDASVGDKLVRTSNVVLLEQEDAACLADNEEVTLMSWGNAIVSNIEKDSNGVVLKVSGRLNLSGDFKKTKKKLTWIASEPKPAVPVTLVELDYLITTPKLDATLNDEEFEAILNKKSWNEMAAFGEEAMRNVKKGQVIQINRRGFYICDRSLESDAKLVLIYIPDGHMGGSSTLSRR